MEIKIINITTAVIFISLRLTGWLSLAYTLNEVRMKRIDNNEKFIIKF